MRPPASPDTSCARKSPRPRSSSTADPQNPAPDRSSAGAFACPEETVMPSVLWSPPAVTPGNVVVGTAPVYTAPQGTAMPSDANLGVGSAWITAGWSFNGATDGGVSLNWNPS